MKRITLALVLVLVVLASTACGMYYYGKVNGQNEMMSHAYPMIATVVRVEYNHDTVVVEDDYGHQWAFIGCDDWCEGDVTALIMDDNGTELIYDDVIMDVRYAGWVE